MKKTIIIASCVIVISIITTITIIYIKENKRKELEEKTQKEQNALVQQIKNNYNQIVKTTTETKIYNDNEETIGTYGTNVELNLDNIEIDHNTKYFRILDTDYYISYKDVTPIADLTPKNLRHKMYIPFNKNVKLKTNASLYKDNKLYIKLKEEISLPILMSEKDRYYVEYDEFLLTVNKEEVSEVINNNNTAATPRKDIAVLAYHAIYDPKTESCPTAICHTEEQFNSHIKYFADNNYLTLTMQELNNFLDGNLLIPQNSVSITIDDGYLGARAIPILEQHKINATMFLITAIYSKNDFQSDFLELHSHSDRMHQQNVCPGGQGGGIKCLPEETILNDLKKSSEALDNSTIFCYPFYEYNDYAISILKKAGYTMAFMGGYYKAKIGVNKYLIPRYTILSYDTVNTVKSLIN